VRVECPSVYSVGASVAAIGLAIVVFAQLHGSMIVLVLVLVAMSVIRFDFLPLFLSRQENFPRQVLLTVSVDVHLGGRDAAAAHPRYLQVRSDFQRRDCVLEQFRG